MVNHLNSSHLNFPEFKNLTNTSNNLVLSIGLVRYSSIPDCKKRSLSPVMAFAVKATIGVAVLNDATLLPNDTGVTLGAGFLGALTTGEGIAVTNTGSAATGGTSITYKVDYVIS